MIGCGSLVQFIVGSAIKNEYQYMVVDVDPEKGGDATITAAGIYVGFAVISAIYWFSVRVLRCSCSCRRRNDASDGPEQISDYGTYGDADWNVRGNRM